MRYVIKVLVHDSIVVRGWDLGGEEMSINSCVLHPSIQDISLFNFMPFLFQPTPEAQHGFNLYKKVYPLAPRRRQRANIHHCRDIPAASLCRHPNPPPTQPQGGVQRYYTSRTVQHASTREPPRLGHRGHVVLLAARRRARRDGLAGPVAALGGLADAGAGERDG